jgi:hypothetical protein
LFFIMKSGVIAADGYGQCFIECILHRTAKLS